MSYLFYKSKIAQLNRSLSLDEYVFRFDISMEKSMIVNIVKSTGYLLNYVADFFMGEWVIV